MNRLQFAARNKQVPHETKQHKKAKRWYEKGCSFCGYRNNCNLEQKKTKCQYCKNIY